MSLSELLAQYDARRQYEQAQLEQRTRHAYELVPALEQLEQARLRVTGAVTAAVKRGVSSAQAAQEAKAQLQQLAREEQALLEQAGLPADYLALRVHCPACGDTGYVGGVRRQACACLTRALLQQERASSQINQTETFEAFDCTIAPGEKQQMQLAKARDITYRYISTFPDTGRHTLVLMGEAGLGKTYLLNCIATTALSRNIRVRKLTAYTLMEDILSGIRQNTDHVSPYLKLPLLLVDDLGTEPMLNNITREYLFTILNERRNGGCHTVVATNLTMEALQDRYGERVFSRLISTDDTSVIPFTGENLRLFGRKEPIK